MQPRTIIWQALDDMLTHERPHPAPALRATTTLEALANQPIRLAVEVMNLTTFAQQERTARLTAEVEAEMLRREVVLMREQIAQIAARLDGDGLTQLSYEDVRAAAGRVGP